MILCRVIVWDLSLGELAVVNAKILDNSVLPNLSADAVSSRGLGKSLITNDHLKAIRIAG